MNALTFDQHSALMLRARREFFEEQDGMFEDMLRQQRARPSPANPVSRGVGMRVCSVK